jgi:hypothetical protein
MTFGAAAMQIDRDIGIVEDPRERFERLRRLQFVNSAVKVQQRCKLRRRGQDDAMVWKRARDRSISGNSGQKIAQAQRPENNDAPPAHLRGVLVDVRIM